MKTRFDTSVVTEWYLPEPDTAEDFSRERHTDLSDRVPESCLEKQPGTAKGPSDRDGKSIWEGARRQGLVDTGTVQGFAIPFEK